MDQIEQNQREQNMVTLNRMLALLVGEAFKECEAKQVTHDQTELVRLIKADILATMKNRLGKEYQSCTKSKDCSPGQVCVDGVCVPERPGFTWPFIDAH